jgi:response regulator NasT
MEEAIRAGVSSYNLASPAPPDVKPLLRAAAALFRRQQAMQDGLRQAENRLHERELVDRAKAILIRRRRMDEPDAYRWLRRQAMRQGRRIAEVAQALIRETEGSS